MRSRTARRWTRTAAAFKQAISACKDLEPPGFTGTTRTPEQQQAALEFAQCIRDNGVKDFPDPATDGPLIDTNRIPSTAYAGWHEHSQRRDAEVHATPAQPAAGVQP